MILPESSNFGTLINYFNFVAWVSYGATFSALIWLRYKRPELERPYKVFQEKKNYSKKLIIFLDQHMVVPNRR